MKILFVNQFGPGSGAPTGRLLGELAETLRGRGHSVQVLATDRDYGVRRRGLSRWGHELCAHVALFIRMLWCGRQDLLFSLSSPACLLLTAGVAARLIGTKHVHWVMDLYPDVAVALGEIEPGLLEGLLQLLLQEEYRLCARVAVLDGDMAERLQSRGLAEPLILPPWPPEVDWPLENGAEVPACWMYSGNLGQAHEWRVLLEVQALLEKEGRPVRLILQGHGAQWPASYDLAVRLGLKQVEWREAVPESRLGESLRAAGVLVVTRKPAVAGLLWPSKLALVRLAGRPCLWIGDVSGVVAAELSQDPRNGVYRADQVNEMAQWLVQVLLQEPCDGKPGRTAIERQRLMMQWCRELEQIGSTGC